MKVIFIYLIIFYSTSLFATTVTLSNEQKEYLKNREPITMCIDPDWEPFEKIENNKHIGISADIIELISQRLGIHIELVVTKDWDETLIYSKEKKCDLLSFLNKTPEREKWLIFTEPIFTDPNVLVARRDYPMIEDISKIKASLALPKGTAMYEFFERDYPNLVFIPTNSEAEAFTLVEEQKVDLTIRSLIVSAHTIKKEGIFNLKIVSKPTKYANYLRMGVQKDDIMLRDILNEGIKTLTKDDIDTIVNKYVNIVVEDVKYYTIGFKIFLTILVIAFFVIMWNYTLRKKIKLEVEKNKIQSKIIFEKTKQIELSSILANISHQIRDTLNHISLINLTLLTKSKREDNISKDDILKSTTDIDTKIEFISNTIQTFLDFYKPNSKIDTFSLNQSIDDIIFIFNNKIKEFEVSIDKKVENDIILKGIRNEFMQVWLNILKNSIEQGIKKDIKDIKISIKIEKDYIIFTDNCGGFDIDIKKELTNPLFSGLGLKMCKDILDKYSTKFDITNKENGAIIKIVFNKMIID